MRPDPTRPDTAPPTGRIIHLGDVRRRKARRQRQPDRNYLLALAISAALFWAVWLAVLFSLNPARLLTYIAFFLPLGLALTATLGISVYVTEWFRGVAPLIGRCLRRGFLLAAGIEVNLALLAAHRWSIMVLGATIVVGLIIDTVLVFRPASRYR